MTCPYREWNMILNNWACEIIYQDCPEVYLDDFQYKECSTYREHEEEIYEYNWMG